MSKLKIGDKVIVTKRLRRNHADVGIIGILVGMDCDGFFIEFDYNGRITRSWCIDVEPYVYPVWGLSKLEFKFIR